MHWIQKPQSVQHSVQQTGSLPREFSGRGIHACRCNMLCNQDTPEHLLSAPRTFSPTSTFASKTSNWAKLPHRLHNNIYGQSKQMNGLLSPFSGYLRQNKHVPCSFQCFISIPEFVPKGVLSELACIGHTFQSQVCRRGVRGWWRRHESLAGAGQDWRVERDATALLAELPDHVLQRPALLRSADHIQGCWTPCTSNMRF